MRNGLPSPIGDELAAFSPRLGLYGAKAGRVWTRYAGSALLSPRPYRGVNTHAICCMTTEQVVFIFLISDRSYDVLGQRGFGSP